MEQTAETAISVGAKRRCRSRPTITCCYQLRESIYTPNGGSRREQGEQSGGYTSSLCQERRNQWEPELGASYLAIAAHAVHSNIRSALLPGSAPCCMNSAPHQCLPLILAACLRVGIRYDRSSGFVNLKT